MLGVLANFNANFKNMRRSSRPFLALATGFLSTICIAWSAAAETVTSEAAAAALEGKGSASLDFGGAGKILALTGRVAVRSRAGELRDAKSGSWLLEGDEIETSASGKTTILIQDAETDDQKTKLFISSETRVAFEKVKHETPESLRDVVLALKAGLLRCVIKNASDPILPTFRVRTPTTFASARSGDFVMRFYQNEGKWISDVMATAGVVKLTVDRAVDGKPDNIEINEGSAAHFSSAVVDPGASMTALKQAISLGEFSIPALPEPSERERLLSEADFNLPVAAKKSMSKRSPASLMSDTLPGQGRKPRAGHSTQLCQAPAGDLNQCAWTCTGPNPKGSKRCRTDLPQVACQRQLCRANGKWAEEVRLPASQADLCAARGSVVRSCGDYW